MSKFNLQSLLVARLIQPWSQNLVNIMDGANDIIDVLF